MSKHTESRCNSHPDAMPQDVSALVSNGACEEDSYCPSSPYMSHLMDTSSLDSQLQKNLINLPSPLRSPLLMPVPIAARGAHASSSGASSPYYQPASPGLAMQNMGEFLMPQIKAKIDDMKGSPVVFVDPKFKTELCKNWTEKGHCNYGQKCRFAHGKQELNQKPTFNIRYKSKPCTSFFDSSVCPYGARCLFKHEERRFAELPRSFYSLLVKAPQLREIPTLRKKRLPIFEVLCGGRDGMQE